MTTYQRIQTQQQFSAPGSYLRIHTIDMHTGGEPLRVILGGFPDLPGDSILAKRRYCQQHYDHLRTALMHEPRGHADMYGCLLVEPNDETADFGILFLHNEGYSTMCGHATIAIAKLAVMMNWVAVVEGVNTIKIDAPCGRITAFVRVEAGAVSGVSFHCVPSFVVALDQQVLVPSLGTVTYDLAYGGAFYAYVDLAKNQLDLDLSPSSYRQLISQGMAIKHAVMDSSQAIDHPFEEDLGFLYGTIFIGPSTTPNVDSRNVCIFAEGEVDRCPTGSGVSGRMAIHYQRGEIAIGESMCIESIVDAQFVGSVVKEVDFGPYQAVVPQVEGNAYVTGQHTFLIDPDDPFRDGFFLR